MLLASASPRRAQLLERMGLPYQRLPVGVDDGQLRPPPGAGAPAWAAALAYLKARAAARDAPGHTDPFDTAIDPILAADTVCEVGGRIVGKPRDRDHAAQVLRSLAGGTHRVVTGLAIVYAGVRTIEAHIAAVTFGPLDDRVIDAYADSGAWRGKAGGYNLEDRLADGWPITVTGDPGTVVGLPTQGLAERIDRTVARAKGRRPGACA